MKGCLRWIGCLTVLLLVAAGGAWWYFKGPPWRGGNDSTGLRTASGWQQLTPEGATRARRALAALESPRGPTLVNVAAGDLAAYIFQELSRTLPSSADSIEAAALHDRLCVRAVIGIKDLGDPRSLGPLSMLLGDRERVQMCGVLRIIRPGLGELQVKEFKIRELSLPPPLIPRLIREMSRGQRLPELSPEGLPVQTPAYITDVHVANGQITLYRIEQGR
jgi:hypothetical protein